MLMITDAASETMIRLDMTDPFLRLVKKLSLRKAQRAGYAKTTMGTRFILPLISAFVLKEPPIEAEPSEDVRGPYPAGRLERCWA
jgi:hypothetical protein